MDYAPDAISSSLSFNRNNGTVDLTNSPGLMVGALRAVIPLKLGTPSPTARAVSSVRVLKRAPILTHSGSVVDSRIMGGQHKFN